MADCRTVQPMMPAVARQSRRRSTLPARITSQRLSTRWPSAATRSAASNAHHAVTATQAVHNHRGTTEVPNTASTASTAPISTGSPNARVQRRVAARARDRAAAR